MKRFQAFISEANLPAWSSSDYGGWFNPSTDELLIAKDRLSHNKVAKEYKQANGISQSVNLLTRGWVRFVLENRTLYLMMDSKFAKYKSIQAILESWSKDISGVVVDVVSDGLAVMYTESYAIPRDLGLLLKHFK